MNWKRIGTGTLVGAAVVLVADIVIAFFASGGGSFLRNPIVVIAHIPPSLLVGFMLTWLYVLARPRLGPGPRTALVTATVAWGFMHGWQLLDFLLWRSVEPFLFSLGVWIKCVVATYLAGWQYIEKAP